MNKKKSKISIKPITIGRPASLDVSPGERIWGRMYGDGKERFNGDFIRVVSLDSPEYRRSQVCASGGTHLESMDYDELPGERDDYQELQESARLGERVNGTNLTARYRLGNEARA